MPEISPHGGPRWLSRITRHRLTFMDQVAFELHRLTGRNQLMQCLWVYDTEVDVEALQGVCDRIRMLRTNRLIEPSGVPFGRPRWVRDDRSTLPVRVGETVLPRTALLAWANTHARTPIDPATGPAWHIGLQRFSDGTSAVSMVGSHVLFDGVFALNTVRLAIAKTPNASSYRARGERGRIAGWGADLGQALLDVPRTLKALGALAALVSPRTRSAKPAAPVAAPVPPADADRIVEMPAATVVVDLGSWNARARTLGGHSHALLLAFCARLALHQHRRRATDGAVSLVIPIDQRRDADDDRALAMGFRTITLDPESVTSDIAPAQKALMAALRATAQQQDATEALLPVVPWIPRATTATLVNQLFRYDANRPVTCSNLGELPSQLGAADGTPCRMLLTRAVDVQVTVGELARTHGHLVIVSSRHNGVLSICIEAYQPGAENSAERLRDIAIKTLEEFGLKGTVEC